MSTHFELIKSMKNRVNASNACIDSLIGTTPGSERFNNLLEVALGQQEATCIEMRRLYEMMRHSAPKHTAEPPSSTVKQIYGELSVTPENWVHIKLNALLPHCKVTGGTQYVSDSILRLIKSYEGKGHNLPFYEHAFLGILETCPVDCSEVFDSDNKGYKAVQNALKGKLFPDDDSFELSLGLFTEIRNESNCHIYILPDDDAGIFTDMRLSHELG